MRNALTNHESVKPQFRGSGATPPGTVIAKDGSPLYHDTGSATGLGDVFVSAKLALLDRDPATTAPRLSVRAAMNVRGDSRFSEGTFLGFGESLDKKLLSWVAFHGDVARPGSWIAEVSSICNFDVRRTGSRLVRR